MFNNNFCLDMRNERPLILYCLAKDTCIFDVNVVLITSGPSSSIKRQLRESTEGHISFLIYVKAPLRTLCLSLFPSYTYPFNLRKKC